MAIEKMELVNIVGNLDALNTAFEICYASGNFHIENTLSYIDEPGGYLPINGDNPYASTLQRLTEFMKTHNLEVEKVKVSDVQLDRDEIIHYAHNVIEKFDQFSRRHTGLEEQIKNQKLAIEHLSHFTAIDIRLEEIFFSQFIKVRFGRIPKDSYPKLSAYQNDPYLIFFPCSVDETHYWGVYFCPYEQANHIDRIFKNLYFERLRVPGLNGTPEEGIASTGKDLKVNLTELKELEEKINEEWEKEKSRFSVVYTFIDHLHSLHELRHYAAQHGSLFHIVGWVPQSAADLFISHFDTLEDIECVVDSPESVISTASAEDPPVKLKNNPFSRPFEMFVSMFGLPQYTEFDPTLFVSITYPILFGIMFGDVGQGFLVIIAGFIMKRKIKNQLGSILMRTGVFSCLFGLVYGSVFGFEDLLDPFYASIGVTPFKPMEERNSVMLLLYSLIIGFVIIVIAMLINIFLSLRRKKFGNALFSPSGLAGLVFYAALFGGVGLSVGFGINPFSLPYILVCLVLPLLLILLREPLGGLLEGTFKKPEQIGGFFVESFFELFESLLSYLSNTISFLRVGAFVLVHVSMMTVVITISHLFGVFGSSVAIVAGNLAVAGLEALLVAIQCLRLHYYEMFGRFYEGGGRPFVPVHMLHQDDS